MAERGAGPLKRTLVTPDAREQLARISDARLVARAGSSRGGERRSYLPAGLSPDQLDDDPWTLVAACLDPSGRLRAAALQRLGPHQATLVLPFALLGLNDWVPQVRAAARQALQGLFTPRLGRSWLHALPLLEHLNRCRRVDQAHLAEVRSSADRLLLGGWNAGLIEEGMRSTDPHVRCSSWCLALTVEPIDLELALEASRQPDARVRSALTRCFERCELPAVEALLTHASARLRCIGLQALTTVDLERAVGHLHAALLHGGRAARAAARALRRHPDRIDRALLDNLIDGCAGASCRAALAVAARLPRWEALPRLLRGAASHDPADRAFAALQLTRWRARHARTDAAPSPQQSVVLRLALADARSRLDPALVTAFESLLEERP